MVAVGRYWHRRDRRGGKSRGLGGGRSQPRPWDSRLGVSPPDRWLRGPAGPKDIVDSRVILDGLKRNMSRGNSLSDELDLSSVLGDTSAYLYSPVWG